MVARLKKYAANLDTSQPVPLYDREKLQIVKPFFHAKWANLI